MGDLRSLGSLMLISLSVLLYQTVCSSPVNISVESVPASLVQSAISSLNENSPTQHTYRGGNLISAQKLLEPNFVIFRLTLNLETICGEGSTNCPREACTLDLKDTSGVIEVDRNSIQCMYLYPQSTQEDVQQVQQPENIVQDIAQAESSASNNADDNKSRSQNTLELDHEVETSSDSQRPDAAEKPFIAVRSPSYCPGCPYELNPNLPGLAAFGVQALDMMDRLGQNDFKHKLIRIVKVTRAVPPGSNVVRYKLLAEIGETNCLKTTLIDRSECFLQGNIPVRVCLVAFEEHPWQQSDRRIVSNNCTQPSELENEINASLNPGLNSNPYLAGNGLPERVDSVQEVIGKTAHIDQLAQEGKIGTYDSLIDQIIENSAANVTQEINVTETPVSEGVAPRRNSHTYESVRRDTAREINEGRPVATEAPFVKVELEREDDRKPVHGFVDKLKEFDEFLVDFDIPMRDTVVRVTEDNRQAVTEEIIRPHKVGGENVAENGSSSSEENTSAESTESREDADDVQRTKRALTSGKTLIEELAQKAVDTLDNIDQDDKKRVVRRILESKKQKVDGFLYHMVMEVALTDCREINNYESDVECLDKIIGPFKICKVQIHTDEKDPLLSARVIKSECSKEPTREKSTRSRRNLEIHGALNSIDIHDTNVKNYANMGLQKYSETATETNELLLTEIVSATKQVVAGSLYKIQARLGTSDCPKGTTENCKLQENSEIKECEITAWVRLWIQEDPVNITVKCNENARAKRSLEEKHIRNRRDLGLRGAPKAISTNDVDVINYANLGMQKHSETLGGTNELILLEILSATRQVVAGSLYKIQARLGTSDCPKGTTENCKLQENSEIKECEIKAWVQLWIQEDPVNITVTCNENARAKRSLKEKHIRNRRNAGRPGAPNAINTNNVDVINYANLGMQKHSETLGGTNEPFLVGILSATKQVVAGSLYKIQVRIGTSDCPKGTTENCKLLADCETKECEIVAWSRPWLSEGALDIQVNCGTNIRSKRGLRGKNYSQKMLEQSTYLKNERLFNDFIAKYNKSYTSTFERKNRFKIFRQNMMMVQELQRNEQGSAMYGASMFADLTTEEFKQKYLGLRPELRLDNEIPIPMAEIPEIEIPDAYDWRKYNVVTPVKNQGQCGSCWAFSVTGNVEGQYALRHKTLLSLSEQELVDCDTLDQGCNGGLPDNAYRAIEKLGGLELESDYPYDGENEACHFDKTEIKVKVVSAVNITSNETQMAQWLVQNGPISIGINANAMQFYMGGVSHPFKFLCSPSNLDHGVLIVGYGIHTYPIFHKKLPYWTIKNSWGPQWGEQGYYRVYRGDGTCGVNQMASSAIVA